MLWGSHPEKNLRMLNFLHHIVSLKATTTCGIMWICESLQDGRLAEKVKIRALSTGHLQA